VADPLDVKGLRQASQLQMQCADFLAVAEAQHARRWETLRRVIEDAGKQYAAMRIDAIEERLQEEGAPLWFSVALTLFVTLVPLSAITGKFLGGLAGATEQLLTRGSRESLAIAEVIFERELDVDRLRAAGELANRLSERIKTMEERAVKFAELYEPEVHHGLVVMAHTLGEAAHKHFYEQHADTMSAANTTDAPWVSVTQMAHRWVTSMVRVEDAARARIRGNARDLFDVATADDPAKEAQAKESAATHKEAIREQLAPKRRPTVKLPRKRSVALQNLALLRDSLEPPDTTDLREPDPADLRSLQLMIESIIWASTYDFTPRKPDSKLENPYPAPLPKALWDRLIERYVDPDANKTYKEVGPTKRLGTVAKPGPKQALGDFDPKVRLSHYLSQILLPTIKDENNTVTQRFKALAGN
jgi:hypothetical protein